MAAIELKASVVHAGRIDEIDELKGLAMLLVILYHAGGVLLWQNFMHGDVGVDLFVILSGVGLALNARPESAGRFLWRRLARIYPVYWVVLTAYLLANVHFLQLRYSVFEVAVHYLGLQALFGDLIGFQINDSFWFVTLIVGLYAAYVLVRPILGRTDLLILVGGALSAAASYAFFLTGQSGCFGHIGLRIPGFFAGLLIGALLRDGRLSIPLSPVLAAGLVVLVYVPYTHGIIFYSELAAIALALGYLFLWKAKMAVAAVAATGRVLRFISAHSLEIFLIHQPLIRNYNRYVLGRFFGLPEPSSGALILGMVPALALTLFLSVELHRLIERLLRPRKIHPLEAAPNAGAGTS